MNGPFFRCLLEVHHHGFSDQELQVSTALLFVLRSQVRTIETIYIDLVGFLIMSQQKCFLVFTYNIFLAVLLRKAEFLHPSKAPLRALPMRIWSAFPTKILPILKQKNNRFVKKMLSTSNKIRVETISRDLEIRKTTSQVESLSQRWKVHRYNCRDFIRLIPRISPKKLTI